MMRCASLIALAFASRNRQPLNLTAGYFVKLGFPALKRAGDEEQYQAVPCFPEFVVSRAFDTSTVPKVRIG
jgi:hypothetical protein